jgi:hypothetical protein
MAISYPPPPTPSAKPKGRWWKAMLAVGVATIVAWVGILTFLNFAHDAELGDHDEQLDARLEEDEDINALLDEHDVRLEAQRDAEDVISTRLDEITDKLRQLERDVAEFQSSLGAASELDRATVDYLLGLDEYVDDLVATMDSNVAVANDNATIANDNARIANESDAALAARIDCVNLGLFDVALGRIYFGC